MKDIFKSLKENATSRFSNPVVGAFVLAWCALNLNGLATFVLSSNVVKLQIISNKEWSFYGDVMFPLLIAIIYLICLPLLNLAYEFINDGMINNFRNRQQNKNNKLRFIRQKSTVEAKIEAGEEYIMKLKEREIDDWISEKTARNNEFINLKKQYSSVISTLNENEKNFANSRIEFAHNYNSLSEKLNDAEVDAVSKLSYLETSLIKVEKSIENIELLPEEYIENDIQELRSTLKKIRIKFNILDIDF